MRGLGNCYRMKVRDTQCGDINSGKFYNISVARFVRDIIFTWRDAQLSTYKGCKGFKLGSWIRLGFSKSGSMDSSRVWEIFIALLSDYISELQNRDYRSIKHVQIGNLNNFGYDRTMIDQDLLGTFLHLNFLQYLNYYSNLWRTGIMFVGVTMWGVSKTNIFI